MGEIKAERQEKPVSTSPLLERTISLFFFLRRPAALQHFHFEVEHHCGALYCNHCFYLVGLRHNVQRHNSSAAPDTMLLGQLQRGRPTHQRTDKPSVFESPGALLQEQSSFGSHRRRLHPHSPSLPCYSWIFPPCSRNSSPRIDRVLRDTCLEHQAEVQPLGYAILPEKEGSPSKHRSTRRSKAHLPPCQPTFSFLSKKYVTGRAAFKSVHPFQNTGRMCCPACQR